MFVINKHQVDPPLPLSPLCKASHGFSSPSYADYFFHYCVVLTNFLVLQILVPVPQYPLYSAAISLFGGSLVPYYLEETANWGLDIQNLRQSVAEARARGITVSIFRLLHPTPLSNQ